MHASVSDIRPNQKDSVQDARVLDRLQVSSIIIFLNAEKFIEEVIEMIVGGFRVLLYLA